MATNYVQATALKASLSLSSYSFADADVSLACAAASRAIDEVSGTRFFPQTGTAFYQADDYWSRTIEIDDLNALTSVTVDINGNGTYSQTWVQDTDFYLQPVNAGLDGRPWDELTLIPKAGRSFPWGVPKAVKIVGSFGWAATPDPVTQYAGILAAKLLRRSRDAPFGIITAGIDQSAAMRIARTDPDFDLLLAPYRKVRLFA